jgi:hypothetical protein
MTSQEKENSNMHVQGKKNMNMEKMKIILHNKVKIQSIHSCIIHKHPIKQSHASSRPVV